MIVRNQSAAPIVSCIDVETCRVGNLVPMEQSEDCFKTSRQSAERLVDSIVNRLPLRTRSHKKAARWQILTSR